jgi:hypothetical protein
MVVVIGLAFSNPFSFSRVRSLEGQVTGIVRELGIQQAQWEQAEKRIGAAQAGSTTE